MNLPFVNEPEFHGTVNISSDIKYGVNCVIWQFATICHNVTLGNNVVVGSNAWIGPGTVIGDGTRIQHGVFIPANTKIGKNVFIGPNATLTDDKYPSVHKDHYFPQSPILNDNCNIGAGSVILPGVIVDQNATVGAGAVVTEHVARKTTVIGVPAKVLHS